MPQDDLHKWAFISQVSDSPLASLSLPGCFPRCFPGHTANACSRRKLRPLLQDLLPQRRKLKLGWLSDFLIIGPRGQTQGLVTSSQQTTALWATLQNTVAPNTSLRLTVEKSWWFCRHREKPSLCWLSWTCTLKSPQSQFPVSLANACIL